jgi:hypothetical protein
MGPSKSAGPSRSTSTDSSNASLARATIQVIRTSGLGALLIAIVREDQFWRFGEGSIAISFVHRALTE